MSGFAVPLYQQCSRIHTNGVFTLHGYGTGTRNGISGFKYITQKCSDWSETGTRTHCFLFCQSRSPRNVNKPSVRDRDREVTMEFRNGFRTHALARLRPRRLTSILTFSVSVSVLRVASDQS